MACLVGIIGNELHFTRCFDHEGIDVNEIDERTVQHRAILVTKSANIT